ncbi:hypothetical protein WSM22_40800 [Cytophagales bacterium WSM2-2]|nr:hypothetical protein WSM22_40800 [Cytophagales bacterium WSM2-2]
MVLLLIDLNRKADDHTQTIAEFKLKMFEKIRKDSLDSKHKIDVLVNETTKFIDNSSHVKERVRYLMGLLGLVVVIEVVFLVLERRNSRRMGIN